MTGVATKFATVCFCLTALSPAIASLVRAQEQTTASEHAVSLESSEDAQQSADQSADLARAARESQSRERSMRVSVNMVLVPVSVTDVMDRPVMDLQKDDFALFQDDEQQKLEYFRPRTPRFPPE